MIKPLFTFAPLALLFLMTACTHQPMIEHTSSSQNKVWQRFDGKLLVIEPTRRWQVLIHWDADLTQGKTRLTHIATSRIIELKWNQEHTYMRDNQTQHGQWKEIDHALLMQYGIILPPQMLSKILHNQIPSSLQSKGYETWQGRLYGSSIRLHWTHDRHQLNIIDISHGRTAILRIQP